MNAIVTVKQRVYQAVVDIHNTGRAVTRSSVADRTGLKFSVVDDHIKSLKDDGKIRLVVNGVFEPAEMFAANRPVSKTVLADGTVKLEVGDEELTLTPGEAHVVGLALHGDAMQMAHIRGEREVYDTVAGLKSTVRAMEKRLGEALQNVAKLEQRQRQEDLFAVTT
jgi:hypothetical protein